MNEYWTATVDGFMDVREAHGPFSTLEEAQKDAEEKLPTFERSGLKTVFVNIDDWFAIHRDSPVYGKEWVMVDGPWPSKERAEQERLTNVKDKTSFDTHCLGHEGFVAQVVEMLPDYRAVLVRQ